MNSNYCSFQLHHAFTSWVTATKSEESYNMKTIICYFLAHSSFVYFHLQRNYFWQLKCLFVQLNCHPKLHHLHHQTSHVLLHNFNLCEGVNLYVFTMHRKSGNFHVYKFQICNFHVQIFLDTNGPSEN